MCHYFYRYSTSERLEISGNPSFVKKSIEYFTKKMKLFLKIMIDKIQ